MARPPSSMLVTSADALVTNSGMYCRAYVSREHFNEDSARLMQVTSVRDLQSWMHAPVHLAQYPSSRMSSSCWVLLDYSNKAGAELPNPSGMFYVWVFPNRALAREYLASSRLSSVAARLSTPVRFYFQ